MRTTRNIVVKSCDEGAASAMRCWTFWVCDASTLQLLSTHSFEGHSCHMALGEDETVLLVKKNLSTTYRVRQGSVFPKLTNPNFELLQAEEAVDCERMWLEELESTEGDRDGKKAKMFHQHLGYRSLLEGSAARTHFFRGLADGFALFISRPRETELVYSLESGEKAWSIDLPAEEWAGGTINLINLSIELCRYTFLLYSTSRGSYHVKF